MSTKGTNKMQRTEWIGDHALRLMMSIALSEAFPEETVEGLRGRLDAYINNKLLSRYMHHHHIYFDGAGGGANGFERYLGELFIHDRWHFSESLRLCMDLIEFAKDTGAEKNFRDGMIKRNTHGHPVKPLPCECGSMNLRFWKRPSQVVCADCKRVFKPEKSIASAKVLINVWNEYRLASRVPEEQYSG